MAGSSGGVNETKIFDCSKYEVIGHTLGLQKGVYCCDYGNTTA